MKFPSDIPVFGDTDFRGKCPMESLEQVTFFNRLRRLYPQTLGAIAIHSRNEGKKHAAQVMKEKAEGMVSGASDIIIPASPSFVCELKRQDHTKGHWQPNQIEYLRACKKQGAFICVALGHEAAWEAMLLWQKKYGIGSKDA